jgi:hypothetical protein
MNLTVVGGGRVLPSLSQPDAAASATSSNNPAILIRIMVPVECARV